jgi:delta14-sterol reductase
MSAFKVYMLWMLGLIALDRVIPGQYLFGTELRSKNRLRYKFNGTAVVLILTALLAGRAWQTRFALPELVYVYYHMLELTNTAIAVSVVLALYVYIASFCHTTEPLLALGGNTENHIYDWFIGRELNPRLGDFDIKVFMEMRPGLLLWVVINLAMAHHQWLKFGHVTDSMILVCIFQCFYVVEGTFYESGLITMIDVTTDGFGFMLSFGDLALVPFTYTLQARYLADHPVSLGVAKSAAIIGVFLVGLLIFRLSNNQKNAFRKGDPKTAHLKYISTPTGSKLLVSGWWGLSRHPNYLGDWIVAWAYSLPTGFATPIPYYFVVFFAVLLIHRELRDEAKCAAKYGDTWKIYKQKVPYRIVPGIF